jgi:hypothetical protein
MLFDVKMDPPLVSYYLGHSSVAFTLSRYVGVRGDAAHVGSAALDGW